LKTLRTTRKESRKGRKVSYCEKPTKIEVKKISEKEGNEPKRREWVKEKRMLTASERQMKRT